MDDVVLLVADSLGMPRDGVSYKDTYIHKLRENISKEFVDRSKRARTTDSLGKKDALEYYNPDIIITQIGIVDCAPRYSNMIERQLFNITPSTLTNPYMNVVKKIRTRKARRQYVKPDDFRYNLEQYYKRTKNTGSQVISIKIAPPSSKLLEANPEVDVEIKKYNEIYDELSSEFGNVEILDPYTLSNIDQIMVDDHHPNAIGHKKIFDSIREKLQ